MCLLEFQMLKHRNFIYILYDISECFLKFGHILQLIINTNYF